MHSLLKKGHFFAPHLANSISSYEKRRPGYKVEVYMPPSYKSRNSTAFGKIKPASRKDMDLEIIKDLYHIHFFGQIAIRLARYLMQRIIIEAGV